MRSTDSTYSSVYNKFEQPIDRIDNDTHTLDKQQTRVSVTFINIFPVMCLVKCLI